MAGSSIATPKERPQRPSDYLSFAQIEEQYPGTVKAETLYVWYCTHRYGFHLLVTKIGRNSRLRRDRWESLLERRTRCNAEKVTA